MNASFDGMRKNATRQMNFLGDILQEMLERYSDDIAKSDMQELIERYNSAAQAVDLMNCLYDDSVADDMNNLSHLSIFRLDDLEDED